MTDWKTIATESLRHANDGSLDPGDAAQLLRAVADAIEVIWDSGVLPDGVLIRLAVKGLMAVLRETADNLDQLEAEKAPEPAPEP